MDADNHNASPLHININASSISFSSAPPPSQFQNNAQMGYRSSHSHSHAASLDIIIPSQTFYIKSLASSDEPSLLSGKVVLTLTETVSVKQIELSLRGKAHLPALGGDSPGQLLSSNYHSATVFSHEWEFLTPDSSSHSKKRPSHTLKPGTHTFPFHLPLDPSTPPTTTTQSPALCISYKLRATVIRSSAFTSNLHAECPIKIYKSLARDALEYQQTLEIENTWPGKVMYSLMIPHKAWAAGDTICTLVKFSPLTKGTSIDSILTTVVESLKVHYPSPAPSSSHTREVASIKHEMWSGEPRVVDTYAVWPSASTQGGMFYVPGSGSGEEGGISIPGSWAISGVGIGGNSRPGSGTSTPAITRSSPGPGSGSGSPPASNGYFPQSPPVDVYVNTTSETDIIAILPITLPPTSTPSTTSHTTSPIEVSYRIKWVVTLLNPDGHTSELRCSLPLMVLEGGLLTEARLATNETRRLCFGIGMGGGGEGGEREREREVELELPSYRNHVMDRVANSFFPAESTRVQNLWVMHGMDSERYSTDPLPLVRGGESTPERRRSVEGGAGQTLEYVNSELMYSLGETWRNAHRSGTRGSDSSGNTNTGTGSNSRSTSPERERERERQPKQTHGHSRFLPSLKPLTHFTSRSSTPKHPHPHPPQTPTPPSTPPTTSQTSQTPPLEIVQPVPLSTTPSQTQTLLMSAFTEVPDYSVASRGFLGGGITPLESMRGLPSYEDSEARAGAGLVLRDGDPEVVFYFIFIMVMMSRVRIVACVKIIALER